MVYEKIRAEAKYRPELRECPALAKNNEAYTPKESQPRKPPRYMLMFRRGRKI